MLGLSQNGRFLTERPEKSIKKVEDLEDALWLAKCAPQSISKMVAETIPEDRAREEACTFHNPLMTEG